MRPTIEPGPTHREIVPCHRPRAHERRCSTQCPLPAADCWAIHTVGAEWPDVKGSIASPVPPSSYPRSSCQRLVSARAKPFLVSTSSGRCSARNSTNTGANVLYRYPRRLHCQHSTTVLSFDRTKGRPLNQAAPQLAQQSCLVTTAALAAAGNEHGNSPRSSTTGKLDQVLSAQAWRGEQQVAWPALGPSAAAKPSLTYTNPVRVGVESCSMSRAGLSGSLLFAVAACIRDGACHPVIASPFLLL